MHTFYKKHKMLIRWTALNIALAGMLALTFIHGENSTYGKLTWLFVWGVSLTTIPSAFIVMALGVVATNTEGPARDTLKEFELGFPLWINTAFDAAYCFGLVWLGWYVTSIFYLAHAILGTMAILLMQWAAEAIESQDLTNESGQ